MLLITQLKMVPYLLPVHSHLLGPSRQISVIISYCRDVPIAACIEPWQSTYLLEVGRLTYFVSFSHSAGQNTLFRYCLQAHKHGGFTASCRNETIFYLVGYTLSRKFIYYFGC
jgi:hypothetical protein